jgi:CheY-like chemotaxis protein
MLLKQGLCPVQIKILIVDDEPAIAESLSEILQAAGYEVATAASGEEAVRRAKGFSPDILLSDVLMPAMNGFELALHIKAMLPDCRLLLFSGQASTAQLAREQSERFTRMGYRFELLPKPLHPDALLNVLEESMTRAA